MQLSGESNAAAGRIAAGPGPLGGGAMTRFAPERELNPELAQAYAAVTPARTFSPTRLHARTSGQSGDPTGASIHSLTARS
jgi:hypothetical protein